MTTYAILGAAGKVGFATSTVLRKAGLSVRAILRDQSKAERLRSIGCEIAIADLQDVNSLTKAFEGAEVVQIIVAPGPAQGMKDVMENLATALEKSHPKRVLAVSDYGAHVPQDIGMPSMFGGFEQRLGQINGIDKIILRSAEHVENWARGVPFSGTLPSLHDPIDKVFPTISAPDLGSIAGDLLLRPHDGQGTKVVHAEGPRRYSANDVAAALSEILERKIGAEAVPRSQWNAFFEGLMPPSLAELLIKANDATNHGGLVDVEPGEQEIRYGSTELKEALRKAVSP